MITEENEAALKAIVMRSLPSAKGAAARARSLAFLHDRVIASPNFPTLPFDNGRIWSADISRSHGRFLHGFLFLADWFETILVDTDSVECAVREAWEIVARWASLHQDENQSGMAYHDETTAQRLMILVALRPYIAAELPDAVDQLDTLMGSTAELLASDAFHSTGNNHGMFQDLSILYWSIAVAGRSFAQRNAFFRLAMRRLREYFASCFTSEGVHVENTPTYHLMISRYMSVVEEVARASGHEDSDFYSDLIGRAERYASHAIQPNGTYPPISDTQQVSLRGSANGNVFPNDIFRFSSSMGESGKEPDERFVIFPESGYAIYRSGWADIHATYVFFSAAYNADYHKHSDDLSVFLRSGGRELITESGPYSYDYKHPLSRYAYSQFAHNSLIVDQRSLPRTDGKQHRVTLRAVEHGSDGFTVLGENGRYENVVHRRTLAISERSALPLLRISDEILSNHNHEYNLIWNLGTELDVVLHGQGFELFDQGRKLMDLYFTSDTSTRVSLHEGEMKPRPMGWRFPKFGEAVPAKAVVVQFDGSNAFVDTSIRLSDFAYLDRGLCAENSDWSRFIGEVSLNHLFVPGKSENGQRHLTVVFSAINERGDFTYNYKATIDQLDTSALYILDDFGDQGAYYHSNHRSEAIFRSVQRLIASVCLEHNIEHSRVAMVGSSKGGAAAMMHGAAFGAGRIIAGAPQTRIGTFLSGPHPNIVEFMAGGTSKQDVEYLDGILFEKLATIGPATRISILVGANDHHLPKHVRPLIDFMQKQGLAMPDVTVLPELSHADIGSVFRHYLSANLEQWTKGSEEAALPYVLTTDPSKRSLRLKVYPPEGTQLAYRLFRDNEVMKRRSFSGKDVVVFENLNPGRYRVRVYIRAVENNEAVAFTTRWAQL